MNRSLRLEGKNCTVWIPAGNGPWPTAYLCGGDMSDQLEELAQGIPPMLLFSCEASWEQDYTPWPAPALPGRAAFTGGAGAHLAFLTDHAVPYLERHFPVIPDAASRFLSGYSLGGLFALWAMGQTDMFGLCGSLSGSLWYDGWMDYAAGLTPSAQQYLYLSLGRSEPHSGGPRMAQVGERTERTQALLSQRLAPGHVTMEWSRGGHFTGIPNRWRKALQWAANIMQRPAEPEAYKEPFLRQY